MDILNTRPFQGLWERILDSNYPTWFVMFGIPHVVFIFIYITIGFGSYFALVFWKASLQRRKLQPDKFPTWEDVKKTSTTVLSHLFFLYPILYACVYPFGNYQVTLGYSYGVCS
eukprot:m.72202 g.72202  ORF g.72202 m.72202 type:complete len:114 (-) comp12310_c0_seq1:30-371(-)